MQWFKVQYEIFPMRAIGTLRQFAESTEQAEELVKNQFEKKGITISVKKVESE